MQEVALISGLGGRRRRRSSKLGRCAKKCKGKTRGKFKKCVRRCVRSRR